MARKYTKPKRPIRRHHSGCGAVMDNRRKKTLYVQGGGQVGPLLKRVTTGAINRTPAAGAINILGTGIRAARGTLPTKGPVNVGGTITSGIGSRMKERRARRKAKRKARKSKG